MINPVEKIPDKMSRRAFLVALGAGLAAAGSLSGGWIFSTLRPVQVDLGNRLVRGTSAGVISQSLDQGQTWQRLANFGTHCGVTSLRQLTGLIYARLVVAGHAFWLSSTDAKTWRTVS